MQPFPSTAHLPIYGLGAHEECIPLSRDCWSANDEFLLDVCHFLTHLVSCHIFCVCERSGLRVIAQVSAQGKMRDEINEAPACKM